MKPILWWGWTREQKEQGSGNTNYEAPHEFGLDLLTGGGTNDNSVCDKLATGICTSVKVKR